MSASASKKKRKELEEQGLSAQAVAERKAKEQKSKTIRNVLIVVLAAVVCFAAVFGVIALVNRPDYDTKAPVLSVGDEKVTVPVYDYFYNLTASNFYNSYSFLIQSGTPLSQQSNFFGEGTLEDLLKENTNTSLGEILNVVAKAKAEGYELSSEQKANVEAGLASIKSEAALYGMAADKYLTARFGKGCDMDSYEDYLKLYMTYAGFAGKLSDEFQPTAEELLAEYEKDTSAYDLVSFSYVTSAAESTTVEPEAEKDGENTDPTGTTTPSTTTTVYTDEAKAAAKEKAESYAEEMPEDATSVSYNKSTASSYLTEEIGTWLFEEGRKEGDVKVFARDENETYYYTVRFGSRDNNDYCRVNANIITIQKDVEGAEIKEGEKTAAEKKDELIAAVKEGMTDEDFNTAITALSYSASATPITRTYSMKEIREWLYDESRKPGDLLTSYENDSAYYLVRYVSTDELSYRDTMVKNNLWESYYKSIAEAQAFTVDEELLKNAFTDLTFNAADTSES